MPPIAGSRYAEEWRYRKDTNYLLGLPEDRLEIAVEMGRDVELGDRFWVDSIQLCAYSIDNGPEKLHVLGEYALGT